MDLTEQVLNLGDFHEELLEVVSQLNDGRGLMGRILGKEYDVRQRAADNRFLVCVTDRASRKRKEGALIVAEIKIKDEGLDGFVSPDRKYDIIRDYLHSLAHQHNIPLGRYLLFNH